MSNVDVATPPETGHVTTIATILISTFFLGGGSALQPGSPLWPESGTAGWDHWTVPAHHLPGDGGYAVATGRRSALTVGAGVGCIAAVAISFSPGSSVWLTTMAYLFGGVALPLYSLSIATVNDQLLSEEMVQSAGALYVIYGLGSMFGPLVAAAIYWMIALVLFACLLFMLLQQSLHPESAVRGGTEEYHPYPALR